VPLVTLLTSSLSELTLTPDGGPLGRTGETQRGGEIVGGLRHGAGDGDDVAPCSLWVIPPGRCSPPWLALGV
jgi:hypothetical protein